MMEQYFANKQQHPNCLLLFRMGDFYELFYEDALTAAPVLGVALTRRGKAEGQDIPMCGVPHHSVDLYVKKLIQAGHKVAMCDQLESPEEAKKRGGHSTIVKRGVTRVITAGTLTDDELLDGKSSNYLASLVVFKDKIALAYAELSTLDFRILPTDKFNLASDLTRINPSELLIADALLVDSNIKDSLEDFRSKLVVFDSYFFDSNKTSRKFKENFGLHTLEGVGNFSPEQIAAGGSLIEYLCITQKKSLVTLKFPRLVNTAEHVVIDKSTVRNLEIFTSIGEHGQSLLQVIDHTLSNAGGRLLKNFLAHPSRSIEKINARLHLVRLIIDQANLSQTIASALKSLPDIERAGARLVIGRGAPKDLYHIRQALSSAEKIAQVFAQSSDTALNELALQLQKASSVLEMLNSCLITYETYLNQGDFIIRGHDTELDQLYNFRDNGENILSTLREEYRNKTGVQNLKLEFNNMLGYYLEVTKLNVPKLHSEEFIHRQTLLNGVRYVTEKLKEVETKLLDSKAKIKFAETRIFNELSESIISNRKVLTSVAQALAFIDVLHSFARLAVEKNYCAPILDESCEVEIKDGRHPVVEHFLTKGEEFIANDCSLMQSQKLWLITGPNMAGKSTFLRQNALIVLLAHIGSYVPASYARVGLVDRIFSRIGAEDDLVKGRSTFLVEMVETATILNQGTDKSLIILDEVGRGTSTYDGIAIAWSCLEHIHNKVKARTLFSTHYHELVELASSLDELKCFTVSVKEWGDKVVFMRKLVPGVANKSYGINVAEIAGLPKVVIDRAKEILAKLHSSA